MAAVMTTVDKGQPANNIEMTLMSTSFLVTPVFGFSLTRPIIGSIKSHLPGSTFVACQCPAFGLSYPGRSSSSSVGFSMSSVRRSIRK